MTKLAACRQDSYIPNEYQKLDIYKRIAAIENEEEKEDMIEELTDRFGDLPKKVEKLLTAASLKAFAHSIYVTAVEQKGEKYVFTMYEKAKIDTRKIPELLERFKGELSIRTEALAPCFVYEKKSRSRKEKGAADVFEVVKNVLNEMKGLIEE